jgi:hypothetical protein
MYNATLKHNLECDIFASCVSEKALSRTNDLLDYLYCELDLNDYLDVLEYTLGRIYEIDKDLETIVTKIYRVAFDRE